MNQRFKKRLLSLAGISSPPPSIPLILPANGTYDFKKNELSLDTSKPRSDLKVLPEAMKMLESITKPVAVISICGPCRTGKSYILSRLLGSADAFALGHTMDAKTFGIWIGTTVLECDDFTLLLMDSEGIDCTAAKGKDDASILVLSVLLSSCLIYNSTGVPHKNDLEKMNLFVKLASSIVVKQSGDDSVPPLSHHFPIFIWLLRDVHLIPTKDGKEITPTDYLTKVVLRRGNGFNETEAEKVGRAIMHCFPSIECKTIRAPSTDPKVMAAIASNQQRLDPQFNKEVEDFVNYLLQNVKEKRGLMQGNKVVGSLLAELTKQYVETVNQPDSIPCISDMWSASIESTCRKATEQLLREYENDMEAMTSKVGMPMEEMRKKENEEDSTTLFGIHNKILQSKRNALIQQVGHFLSSNSSEDGNIEELLLEFEQKTATFEESSVTVPNSEQVLTKKIVVGGSLKNYAEKNYEASLDHCRSLFEALYQPIAKKVESQDSPYAFKTFLEDLQALEENYLKRAIGPAKWDVYQEKKEYIEQNKKAFQKLSGYQQKAFDDAKQFAELNAKLTECESLAEQTNKEKESYEEKLQEMQQYYTEEAKRIGTENSQRYEAENERYRKLMETNMKVLAEQSKENKEQLQAERKMFTDMMLTMNKKHTEMLEELHSRPPQIIEREAKSEDGGCSLL